MDAATSKIVNQIESVISEYEGLVKNHKIGQCNLEEGVPIYPLEQRMLEMKIYTKISDAIFRFSSKNSAYTVNANVLLENINHGLKSGFSIKEELDSLTGILSSLKEAYISGYLITIEELVNAELFSDFMEMADYYLNEGHKDAAAVILGGVLEEHLRKLCQKNSISITHQNAKGQTLPKKASVLNDDLTKNTVYNIGYKKQIDAWLNIRNSAAHGKYSEYTRDQVQNMLDGMRTFINAFPA